LDLVILELEVEMLPSFTREMIGSVISGINIKQIIFHVNKEENKSLLRIHTEEELNDVQCEEMKIS
jgi:hypothetical protein